MSKNIKKKKGFTLIELVIVLAVLAIIALIAIPNFTRVRNESLIKADYRAAEQIEKITLLGIANDDIKIPTDTTKTEIKFKVADNGVVKDTEQIQGADGNRVDKDVDFKDLFRDANGPQVPSANPKHFLVTVNNKGEVTVGYPGVTIFNGKQMEKLAGIGAEEPKDPGKKQVS